MNRDTLVVMGANDVESGAPTDSPSSKTLAPSSSSSSPLSSPSTTAGPEDVELIRKAAHTDPFGDHYELGVVLGAGTSGIVFRAVDRTLDRTVAIKFLIRLSKGESRGRFLQESRILTEVAHPNIVSVLEVGQLGDHPYTVLEYLDGGTLGGWLAAVGRLGVHETVGIALGCLAGLQACHSRGVVHRDLKPENIMFSRDGRVKVGDLGMAKVCWQDQGLTQTGAILGTPLYMAPEQIRGELVGPAADLYSLGIILYQMLSGRVPFRAPSVFTLMQMHVETPPDPLESLQPDLPPSLVALVHKSIHKDPACRPPTVESFAADLMHLLGTVPPVMTFNVPVASPRVDLDGPGDAMASTVRRRRPQPRGGPAGPDPAGHPARLFARLRSWKGLSAGAILVLGALRPWAWTGQGPSSVESSSGSAISRTPGDPGATPRTPGAARVHEPKSQGTNQEGVRGLKFSPDGAVLAVAARSGRLWTEDSISGRRLTSFQGHTKSVRGVAFSPDGQTLASVGEDTTFRIWDVRSGQLRKSLGRSQKLTSIAWSPMTGMIAIGGYSGLTELVDRNGAGPPTAIEWAVDPRAQASALAFSPDGRRLAIAGPFAGVVVWDLAKGKVVRSYPIVDKKKISAVEFSPDGGLVVWADHHNQLGFLDVAGPDRPAQILEFPGEDPDAVAFSRDGKWLVSGGQDGALYLCDVASRTFGPRIEAHARDLRSLAMTRDGHRLVTGDDRGTILRWDWSSPSGPGSMSPSIKISK